MRNMKYYNRLVAWFMVFILVFTSTILPTYRASAVEVLEDGNCYYDACDQGGVDSEEENNTVADDEVADDDAKYTVNDNTLVSYSHWSSSLPNAS